MNTTRNLLLYESGEDRIEEARTISDAAIAKLKEIAEETTHGQG